MKNLKINSKFKADIQNLTDKYKHRQKDETTYIGTKGV